MMEFQLNFYTSSSSDCCWQCLCVCCCMCCLFVSTIFMMNLIKTYKWGYESFWSICPCIIPVAPHHQPQLWYFKLWFRGWRERRRRRIRKNRWKKSWYSSKKRIMTVEIKGGNIDTNYSFLHISRRDLRWTSKHGLFFRFSNKPCVCMYWLRWSQQTRICRHNVCDQQSLLSSTLTSLLCCGRFSFRVPRKLQNSEYTSQALNLGLNSTDFGYSASVSGKIMTIGAPIYGIFSFLDMSVQISCIQYILDDLHHQ